MISGFNINDDVIEAASQVSKKKFRYAVARFDKDYKNLILGKCGPIESNYEELVNHYKEEFPNSFCYAIYHFEFKNNDGHYRNKVVCLKLGIASLAKVKDKMIYASSFKCVKDNVKTNISIDCNDNASLEYNNVLKIVMDKCSKY
ncbi:hypothetical protein A3Q56_05122 [Intoshia linei]|uniref:ADF-H domain-containing protein n=1 Tax=Intoshia linei TaxID=1819745 RepID=A0A177AZ59_9BILA|nr:hypothetical protein A3Q56_05122 [Intoshia linei]